MYLGIDIGSSSIKVLAFDNGCSYKASADYPAGTGMMEQDASAVRQTVAEAVKKLFSGQPVSPGSIAGIGLCGHGPSIVFADRQGHAVTPIVTWQDRRACDEAAMLRRLWPGFEKDGTSFEAKLIWYFNHQRDVFREGLTALYLAYNGKVISCRVPSTAVPEQGQEIGITFRMDKALLFHREPGICV